MENIGVYRRFLYLSKKLLIGGGYLRINMIGSSKGGTCAILYGLLCGAKSIVAGAPQYKIGSYLNCNYHINSLRKLTGEKQPSADKIKELDEIVPRILRERKNDNIKIFLHYSDQEHTYKEHIMELLYDLHKYGYKLIEDIEHYNAHNDVGIFFPEYMVRIVKNEI